MIRIGIDTGGTFTDFVLLDGTRVAVHKVRSTPDDPARAILLGIGDLLGDARPDDIVHGSTVATNAVLERKGARVAMVATRGFEDVLRIGRQTRRELYNFQVEDRRPIVEPGMTLGIDERLAHDGTVLKPLDEAALDECVRVLKERNVDAVAVCLLHAYANPAHEARIAARLEAEGFLVSASHRVLPEYREFERWSTTAVNAYVTPLMAKYLGRLERELQGARLSIMQSNGGSISARVAGGAAVQTILSGPAGGAVGALAVATASGFPKVITFDMGGTSTDVSLIDGRIGMTTESHVGDFPVRLPMIDIHTVGAGGGSIAFIDSGGALRVGPRSAGADPGPVCYGKGTELTVTDANLLLGRLDPDYFLGGRMSLDVERARSVARAFASKLNLTEMALAEGIVRVANANMERAIRVVSVQRGFDTRDFALLAFGGAGGMHACEIAESLDISTVIAPRHAGVLSALGMLLADATKDYSHTVLRPVNELSDDDLEERFSPIVERAQRELAAEGFPGARVDVERALDVRYVGQSYEITVPFVRGFRDEFDRRHERLYGYANPHRATEVVNLRVKGIGRTDKPALPRTAAGTRRLPDPVAVRRAWFGGRAHETAIFRRESLEPGMTGRGPAILAGGQATTVIPPTFAFRLDEVDTVVVERQGARTARRTRR